MTLEGKVTETGDQYHQLLDLCCSAFHCSSSLSTLACFWACSAAASSAALYCAGRGEGREGEGRELLSVYSRDY